MKKASQDPPEIIASKRSGPQPGAHGHPRDSTTTFDLLQPEDAQAVNLQLNDLLQPISENASPRPDTGSKYARPSSLDTGVPDHQQTQTSVVVSDKSQATDSHRSLSTLHVQIPPGPSGKEERKGSLIDRRESHALTLTSNFHASIGAGIGSGIGIGIGSGIGSASGSGNGSGSDLNKPQGQGQGHQGDGATAGHGRLGPPFVDGQGEDSPDEKRTLVQEIRRSFWLVATRSWMNILLVFVPVGIITSQIAGIHGGVVFAVNCIAIIPLAGLLSFATESVASEMGDALGALLNVTFGNAVELIIFIIALAKDQIRIVQASLLGSILANLLLILGMCFFFGGLRYREQVYNSTVTQMSACLLSLSVISLVLPTAFHASFADSRRADDQSLKISRGTSVILLIVYIIYLLFQLKSHAYLYESTPQHIVDAESVPGPAAAWLDTSSSDSSSSDTSDSDDSGYSRDTVKRRMKKVLRAGRRRRSSAGSTERHDLSRSTSFRTNTSPLEEVPLEATSSSRPALPRLFLDHHREGGGPDHEGGERTADQLLQHHHHHHHHHHHPPKGRGSRSIRNNNQNNTNTNTNKRHKKRRHHQHQHHRRGSTADVQQTPASIRSPTATARAHREGEPRRLDFAIPPPPPLAAQAGKAGDEGAANGTGSGGGGLSNVSNSASRRPFPGLRTMSVRNLAPTVFVQKPQVGALPAVPAGPVPRVRLGIRRTNSLPDRLREYSLRAPGAMLPSRIPMSALDGLGRGPDDAGHDAEEEHLSQWAAVVLLLVTTGLVAACAEFLVGSIEDVTSSSSLGEAFIGLILLPIVGNAAEHVTALTVAMKNKMDLAIGVAVGSSIQIAIFVTPLVVILGWIIGKDMTLYFTLFETVCLFVSAFIVNFLVLDGRSNYLEGALLCAVYCIIGVVAFFYPAQEDTSSWGS